MPSLKKTFRFMNVGVSSNTSQLDIGATKSSGERHLTNIADQSFSIERMGVEPGGLMGMVWDW